MASDFHWTDPIKQRRKKMAECESTHCIFFFSPPPFFSPLFFGLRFPLVSNVKPHYEMVALSHFFFPPHSSTVVWFRPSWPSRLDSTDRRVMALDSKPPFLHLNIDYSGSYRHHSKEQHLNFLNFRQKFIFLTEFQCENGWFEAAAISRPSAGLDSAGLRGVGKGRRVARPSYLHQIANQSS